MSKLRKQAKVKDEMLAKAAEEVEKVGTVCKEIVAKSEGIYQAYKKSPSHLRRRAPATSSSCQRSGGGSQAILMVARRV